MKRALTIGPALEVLNCNGQSWNLHELIGYPHTCFEIWFGFEMWEVTNGKKWSDPQNFRHSMVIPSSSLCEMRSWRYILWHFGGWGLWSQKGRCHSPLSSASAKQRVWTIGSSPHMCAYLGFGKLINPCIISVKHKIHLLIIRIMAPPKHKNNKYYIGYIFWWWWSMFSVATRGWLEGTHVDLIGAWQSHQWKKIQVWPTVFLW